MANQTIQVGVAPRLEIYASGKLNVRGAANTEVVMTSDGVDVRNDGDRFVITAKKHCDLVVPDDAFLIRVEADRHVEIRGVQGAIGPVSVENGNLIVIDVGPVYAREIAGNLTAERVHGALKADEIGGDMRVKQVMGQIEAGEVGGNFWLDEQCESLSCKDIGGNCHIRHAIGPVALVDVGGNVEIDGPTAAIGISDIGGNAILRGVGCAVSLQDIGGNLEVHGAKEIEVSDVGGNMNVSGNVRLGNAEVGDNFYGRDALLHGDLHLEVGGNAEFKLSPQGGELYQIEAGGNVNCALSDNANAEITIEDCNGRQILRVGSGGAEVRIEAGGVAHLSGAAGAEVRREARQNGRKMGSFKIKLPQIPMIPPLPEFPDIGAEIDAAFRSAGWPFERDSSSRDQRSQRRAEPPAPPVPPEPPVGASGATEEERLAILRMLAEKKITLAQAEQLLSALETTS